MMIYLKYWIKLKKSNSSKMLWVVAKCYGGSSKMLHNNNIYNNRDNYINIYLISFQFF